MLQVHPSLLGILRHFNKTDKNLIDISPSVIPNSISSNDVNKMKQGVLHNARNWSFKYKLVLE